MVKDIYDVGQLPPLGELPKYMYAWTIRTDRLGSPNTAFKQEIVEIPKLKEGEMIIANRMAGVNYNGVWAALGKPKNVVEDNGDYDERQDFHICGSETSGIVYAVGAGVTEFSVGDEVCVGGAQYDENCPLIKSGEDPCFSPSYRIWGYEANWGGFAQFSKVKPCQCVKKPKFLDWAEAAACTATGVTVYRMLNRWQGNEIRKGDIVLVWGGYGGIGTSAIPLIRHFGAIPVVVVSSEEKGEKCIELGAVGYINRKIYDHWGDINNMDERQYRHWVAQAGKFKKEIYKIVGEKKDPRIVPMSLS
ncbi:MAG: alcohol dehydrogenase catalytic domain-containing protein [Pseudobutyrivibrio sp.]|uniref:alcohol dehydrogenase catalytic domain-containing protein n=1 Tax=Pseudobutyrivibrio sp. TaxID=2014367 RepID=UPI0025E20F78|nr:alcohol dehydrogenase catalytic domain-containing protein [Pseudobutyrivibrio sp.]MBQ8489786.1 alcohol dehydrogenase catalytic domain-containing protein [Pseudobutyrivibrio sp.]